MSDTNEATLSGSISAYPILHNEEERLAALRSYHILDTAEEKDFDDLTKLASAICQTPVALVSLVDKDRQWFKSKVGIPASETAREYSFCAHAIARPQEVLVVKDATLDERFANNPLVTGDPHIAFYAGVPLVDKEGFALGSLCVIDSQVRELSAIQIDALMVVAKQVVDKLELRRKVMQLETANQQLHKSEQRFRDLISQAPVAVAIYNGPELVIEQANDKMLKLWGRTNEVIGLPLRAARLEIADNAFISLLDEILVTGKEKVGYSIKGPFYHHSDDGDRYFDATYKPIIADDGKVTGVIVVAADVTEQHNAEQAINETNQRLAMALDAGALGSYDLDLKTGVMLCTEQCKQNFGLANVAEFNFAQMLAAILPQHRDKEIEAINQAAAKNILYHSEYEVRWPDGSIHWISTHGKPRYDNAGNAIRMVGVTVDITDVKLDQQRKDDFLSIASHELKTPLTSLKASLQLLNVIKEKPASPLHIKLIDQSNKSMEKINTLIDDLLNVNRFTDGHLQLNKSTFTIAHMLGNCCNHVRIAGMRDLVIEGDESLTVCADEHRIDQVVVNFVNNAVKYAPESKEIYLSVIKVGSNVKISVRDTGPGIAREKLAFLFDRYYRADHSGSLYSGLGLGLYICSEIIKKHGGQIGVDSELGKGSTFWFTLPLQG